MACVSGTNVVNDGLVFHFDLENTVKSWKGKPTSNLFAGTNLLNWSGTSSRIADTTVLSETYNGGTIWHLEDADGVNPNVSVDNFYMYNSYGPVSTGEVYTFSLDVKVLQKSNIPNGGATNAIWIWYAASTEYVYLTNLPLNEWTRVHVTCTVGSTYNYLIPRIDYDSNIIEISNIQFEQGNIATKFTSGIRLDTASIIDISPSKSTITAANLTYRQDDTPTFDGTDDYVEIDSSVVPVGSSVTLDIWVKDITVTATNAFYAGNSADGRTLSVHLPWSDQVVYFDSGGATGSTIYDRITYTSTSTDRVGWHNWTFTKDLSAGVMRIYLDGAQKASSAGKNISPDISTLARIGSALSTNYFSGEISQVKIYNRALTATEIKQNFESIRSRYNV